MKNYNKCEKLNFILNVTKCRSTLLPVLPK